VQLLIFGIGLSDIMTKVWSAAHNRIRYTAELAESVVCFIGSHWTVVQTWIHLLS